MMRVFHCVQNSSVKLCLDKEQRDMTKYIFVTGGVVSGLGKGITAASLGRLLKARGIKVAAQKLDQIGRASCRERV